MKGITLSRFFFLHFTCTFAIEFSVDELACVTVLAMRKILGRNEESFARSRHASHIPPWRAAVAAFAHDS